MMPGIKFELSVCETCVAISPLPTLGLLNCHTFDIRTMKSEGESLATLLNSNYQKCLLIWPNVLGGSKPC